MLNNTLPIDNHRAHAEPDQISLSRCAFDAPPGRILLTFIGFCASEVRTSARRSTQAAEKRSFSSSLLGEISGRRLTPHWAFDLQRVAEHCPYLDAVKLTDSIWDVNVIVGAFREEIDKLPWEDIPV